MGNQKSCPVGMTFYSDLREKWKHEDDLINQRITWLLASQGFLMSAFGVVAKLRLETAPELLFSGLIDDFGKFYAYGACELIIIGAGGAVTKYFQHGIDAAIRAMRRLKLLFQEHQEADRICHLLRVDVLDEISEAGTTPAQGMIVTFGLVWIVLILYEVFSIVRIGDSAHAESKVALFIFIAVLALGYYYKFERKHSTDIRRSIAPSPDVDRKPRP